jgi:hypothetical protein
MEDELRPLPHGWVRSYDPENEHQFFVDTTKDPPRSVWHHPYDDEEYLNSLTGEERERVEQESINYRDKHRHNSREDMIHAHSDDEEDHHAASSSNQELPPRPDGKGKDKVSFGRKLKDKVTGMTHEQREEERRKRAIEERKMYETHLRVRQAMNEAMRTGQPQLLGKDRDGKDIYLDPPRPPYVGGSSYGVGGGYGWAPYNTNNGIYTTPNARYVRPQVPYGRPYGRGMGGGYGLPLALGGGLLGGLLIGDMMF